jgi:hypothetical protein
MRISEQLLGVARAEDMKPKRVARNTVRYTRTDGTIVWRLHRTDVVTKHPDGTFTLNTGGWETVTTKDRINNYSPARVFQKNHAWFVAGRKPDGSYDWDNVTPFYDGMKVDARGVAIPGIVPEGSTAHLLKTYFGVRT